VSENTTPKEIEEVTPETIKKLLEKAKDTEWRYLLKIHDFVRRGRYTDYAEFEVIYGEANLVKIEVEQHGEEYEESKYIVVPKTIPVILIWETVEHYGDERVERKLAYIFTKDGWKQVDVY
jgi:hypothetical protein